MKLKAVRALLSRLWGLSWVRWSAGILAVLGILLAIVSAAWRAYVHDRAITADALSRTQAALSAEVTARAAAEADSELYRDQAETYKAALEHPKRETQFECNGLMTFTRSPDGTEIQTCEGLATTADASTPVFPPAIQPGQATAGMGAAAAGAIAAAANASRACPEPSRLSVVTGAGIRPEDLPAVRIRYLVGADYLVLGIRPGIAVAALPWTGYLTVRYP